MINWRYITTGFALLGLMICLGGCCTSDDDDDFNPLPHNEGNGTDA